MSSHLTEKKVFILMIVEMFKFRNRIKEERSVQLNEISIDQELFRHDIFLVDFCQSRKREMLKLLNNSS